VNTRASLFEQAVKAARDGNISKADRLLSVIEGKGVSSEKLQINTASNLIAAIREKYNIYKEVNKFSHTFNEGDQPDIKEGVSLVTCCMNRTENLLKALATWLEHDRINEVIIVDWSSDRELKESLHEAGFKDDRIRVIRVMDEPRWVLSYAFNLGFRYARHERILKTDADIMLKSTFFKNNNLQPGMFIAGSWEVAEKGQEHINGFFYVFRENLLNVKGFNEYITTYGWDDDDIYERLKGFGLKRVCVDVNSIYHIQHDDFQRLGRCDNKLENALEELHAVPMFKIRANRYLAMMMPPWKVGREFAPFDVLSDDGSYVRVRRKKTKMPHYVSSDMKQNAEYHAALELVSWKIGAQVYHLPRDNFHALLKSKKLDEISKQDVYEATPKLTWDPANEDTCQKPYRKISIHSSKPKFYIDAQHGLGNRLRAIASAACIAEKSERELVVVWQPDDHNDCRLHDLFDYDGAVIEECFAENAIQKGCTLFNYMEIEAGAEKDAEIRMNGAGDIYVRSAYALNSPLSNWEDENRFLQTLRPVAEVLDMVASVRAPNDLSAHIRMVGGREYEHLACEAADNWTEDGHEQIDYWRKKSHFSHFMKRIDDLIKDGRGNRIFLAADKPETYEKFLNLYGDRVACLSRQVYDRSAVQLRYALADALLLGSAPLLLGSTWSSFSELAERMSKQKMTIEMSWRDF